VRTSLGYTVTGIRQDFYQSALRVLAGIEAIKTRDQTPSTPICVETLRRPTVSTLGRLHAAHPDVAWLCLGIAKSVGPLSYEPEPPRNLIIEGLVPLALLWCHGVADGPPDLHI
jgi:hypothetical protein